MTAYARDSSGQRLSRMAKSLRNGEDLRGEGGGSAGGGALMTGGSDAGKSGGTLPGLGLSLKEGILGSGGMIMGTAAWTTVARSPGMWKGKSGLVVWVGCISTPLPERGHSCSQQRLMDERAW